MRRRTVLAGITALPIASAGCLGAAPSDPDGTDTNGAGNDGTDRDDSETPTETETPPGSTVTGDRFTATFSPRRDCPNPGEATVDFGGDGPVSVVGCVVGKNGCTVARLRGITYDEEADELLVVVTTVEERDEDEACTQQIVHRGYEVTVEVDGAMPASVRVVHDDDHEDGRRTVVDVTR